MKNFGIIKKVGVTNIKSGHKVLTRENFVKEVKSIEDDLWVEGVGAITKDVLPDLKKFIVEYTEYTQDENRKMCRNTTEYDLILPQWEDTAKFWDLIPTDANYNKLIQFEVVTFYKEEGKFDWKEVLLPSEWSDTLERRKVAKISLPNNKTYYSIEEVATLLNATSLIEKDRLSEFTKNFTSDIEKGLAILKMLEDK